MSLSTKGNCHVTFGLLSERRSAIAVRNLSVFYLRPFLDMVYNALDCATDDYYALFVLCLLYAMSHSKGEHNGGTQVKHPAGGAI